MVEMRQPLLALDGPEDGPLTTQAMVDLYGKHMEMMIAQVLSLDVPAPIHRAVKKLHEQELERLLQVMNVAAFLTEAYTECRESTGKKRLTASVLAEGIRKKLPPGQQHVRPEREHYTNI